MRRRRPVCLLTFGIVELNIVAGCVVGGGWNGTHRDTNSGDSLSKQKK